LKILVVGDSYVGTPLFQRALGTVGGPHRLRYLQLDEAATLTPRTPSERSIHEYLGTPGQVAAQLRDEDVLVVHGAPVTKEVLDAAPDLKLVCCARGGPVNVDVWAATRRGIPVVHTPGKNAEAVADLTLAFMVMLARGVPQAQAFVREAGNVGTSAFQGAGFFGVELGGRTLGLVGYGQVGRRVARRALAFGMGVAVFDPYVGVDGETDVEPLDLDQLLARSDVVSLHARATAETADLMGRRELGLLRPGSFLVNTARETLVDERALYDALVSGRLRGAALDVLRPWPGPGMHPLVTLDNVVVTPHIGGATSETLARGARMVAEEVERFASGEPLRHVINRADLREGAIG
jgi:D-3-phosphoglycerate dehydrogenase